jgi:hypothetical protein
VAKQNKKRLSMRGKLGLEYFGELTRYILTFFAAFINELATQFVTEIRISVLIQAPPLIAKRTNEEAAAAYVG